MGCGFLFPDNKVLVPNNHGIEWSLSFITIVTRLHKNGKVQEAELKYQMANNCEELLTL